MTHTAPPSPLATLGAAITKARNFVLNTLFVIFVVFLLLLFIGSLTSPSLPAGAALLINPTGVVVEDPEPQPPIGELLGFGGGAMQTGVNDIVRVIAHAAEHKTTDTIVLQLDELTAISAVHAMQIGNALQNFRRAGGQVLAFGGYYDQGQYLLASYADEIYLHPMGQVSLQGYGIYTTYFKELLDKLDINVHIFRAGEFKDAVEPFSRADMSPASREANKALVDTLWQAYLTRIALNRELGPEQIRNYSERFDEKVALTNGDLARTALEDHLIDELLSDDEFRQRVAQRAGWSAGGDVNMVDFRQYLHVHHPARFAEPDDANVALIVAEGPIVSGVEASGVIAADETVELIRRARRDEQVKAIVLRINSPGGSAFASELIRQELELAQLEGKPVVASFGPVAASGGYWIAATADEILAEPMTLTGSIGVFSMVPTFEKTLNQAGVTHDGVGTTPFSNGFNPFSGIATPMQRVLQASVEHTYDTFINLVARGRDLSIDQVAQIAEGRVWSAEAAQSSGLVTRLGTLDDALTRAAELASLEEWGVRTLEPTLTPQELLFQALSGVGAEWMDRNAGPGVAALTGIWQRNLADLGVWQALLGDTRSPYALCEACMGYE